MIGFEALPLPRMLAALLASALYLAAYLSFLRLLRYLRSWYPPSLPVCLTTASLVVLIVALISLSPDGVDHLALAVSVGFIIVLFYIVAAPAIAFWPASGWSTPLVEFLAKHGDLAGLWLQIPAFCAGLAISNIKLQVFLATAMAIELTWSLRKLWVGRQRRHLYPLLNSDLSILEAQAKGDIAAFRRRHGIRELMLSNGTVGWNGCGKGTPACPGNLYINRLGLNTPPCCRAHMKDLSHFVATSLVEMGVIHWLEGGTLLGAVRENGSLLDWEDDVDLSVLLDEDMNWERLAAGLSKRGARDGYYVDLFKKKGFISISFDPPKRWPFRWERYRLRGEIRADIIIYRRAVSHGEVVLERRSQKGAMPATESGGYGVPLGIVLPTSRMPFLGRDIACPNQAGAYLRILYGDFKKIEYTYVGALPAKARARIDTVGNPRDR